MSASFLGKGWQFPIQVDETTGRIKLSAGEENIAESIRIILRTFHGERVMRPEFGSGVNNFLFSETSATNRGLLKSTIMRAIIEWEPRVDEVDVSVTMDSQQPTLLQVAVAYRIRQTNEIANLVYPFYLESGLGS